MAPFELEGHRLLGDGLVGELTEEAGPGTERDRVLVDQQQKAQEQITGVDLFGVVVLDASL